MTTRSDENLKLRRLLCDDLYYLILQDKDIAEELIDEYVYHLDDNRIAELQDLCNTELGAESNIEFSEIAPESSYASAENNDPIVINLPEGNNLNKYEPLEHTSEGC